MADEPYDEISQWANNLTPEGAPGMFDVSMRQLLGDKGYEQFKENNTVREMQTLTRGDLMNKALTLGLAYGLLGLVLIPLVTLVLLFS